MSNIDWSGVVNKEDKLATAKAQAKQNVIAFAAQIGEQLTADYPLVEREAWITKLAEAKAIIAGETDPLNYPAIASEISVTGKTAAEIAPVIIFKAALFEKASGLISGVRQVTFIAIEAATSEVELELAINTARTSAETALAQLLA